MALDTKGIVAAAASHAQTLARFEQVLRHEPKNAPGAGMTLAIWAQNLRPARQRSGLASTSVRLELAERIYLNFRAEPEDEIDERLLDATDALMGAYSGDFDLGAGVDVDLLGAHGDPMQAAAGYLEQDSKVYRIMGITLPLIVNDLWSQAV